MDIYIKVTSDNGNKIERNINSITYRRLPEVTNVLMDSIMEELIPVLEEEDKPKGNLSYNAILSFIDDIVSIAIENENWFEFNKFIKDQVREWYADNSSLCLQDTIPYDILTMVKDAAKKYFVGSIELACILNKIRKYQNTIYGI